jgi:hypothetical protein
METNNNSNKSKSQEKPKVDMKALEAMKKVKEKQLTNNQIVRKDGKD